MTAIVGVLGSVTPPGRLLRALESSLDAVRAFDPSLDTTLLNLADYRIGFADGRPLEQLDDDSPAVVRAIEQADAVILASPVYRATMTGSLKNLLDLVPVEGLRGKPCGIIAMGATPHHYLGVDWHLWAVLAWFGAHVCPNSVYLASADFVDGSPTEKAQRQLRELGISVARLRKCMQGAGVELGPSPLALSRA